MEEGQSAPLAATPRSTSACGRGKNSIGPQADTACADWPAPTASPTAGQSEASILARTAAEPPQACQQLIQNNSQNIFGYKMRWAYDEGLMTGTHESGERQQPPEREREQYKMSITKRTKVVR